ncbi:MAG TPA: M15 family peptidase, partial [Epsilonproteobacteria bacterium]|nr:M15 family peptidase [Campylobacterota bacterium]
YGKAIDINPLENPYVSKNGHISHKKSYIYAKRAHIGNSPAQRAVIVKGDAIVKLFKSHGWRWGGEFRCCKDYQHFDKK